MITSTKNYTKINIKIRNKSVADSEPQVYSGSQSLLPQFCDDSLSIQVFHRCGVHQVDCGDLICCSWGCTVKFPSLLCLHSSWGSALVLASPLHVGRPQASVPCPDRRALKQRRIMDLLLTHAGRREGFCSYNWNAGRAHGWQRLPWCCNSLRHAMCYPGEVVPGSRDPGSGGLHRLLGVRGVDSDLCLHTGFLVAAATALASHAHLWGPRW